eukprot:m.101396 g.101396  ORF g.101396 m.101396 type:complete len:52 (+) comp15165_c0_seq1:167-322(+)
MHHAQQRSVTTNDTTYTWTQNWHRVLILPQTRHTVPEPTGRAFFQSNIRSS